MARSILEAIKEGNWDFEPETEVTTSSNSTDALPGSDEKLKILAERLRQGMPLWHPRDRRSYSEIED